MLIGRIARIPNISRSWRLLADEAKVIYNRVHRRCGMFPELTCEQLLLMGWDEANPSQLSCILRNMSLLRAAFTLTELERALCTTTHPRRVERSTQFEAHLLAPKEKPRTPAPPVTPIPSN